MQDLLKNTEVRQRGEASEAVRLIAQGKTRDEVRDVLEAELLARGLQPPPGIVMDFELDSIMTERNLATRFQLGGRWIRMVAEIGKEVSADIHMGRQSGLNLTLDKDPIVVSTDRSLPVVEPELDPGAFEWLNNVELGDAEESGIFVLLTAEETPVGVEQVVVHVADHRVGAFRHGDATAFRASLEAGRRSNRSVVVEAILQRRLGGGPWRLYVHPPSS
jgi:hypothetical protein